MTPWLEPIRRELSARDAIAVVAVGPVDTPAIRYCLGTVDESARDRSEESTSDRNLRAIAVTATDVLVCRSDSDDHPAERLATDLTDRDRSAPTLVLTPPDVPHDAALYLENAGISLASTSILDRARAAKTAVEQDRLAEVQAAAAAGVRRGAAVLAETTADDGVLMVGNEPLTADRLRREIDAAVVGAGGFPATATRVERWADADETGADDELAPADPLRPGDPVVVSLAPRGSDGYRGGLVRTFVPESDGGWERRAHVALTQAFRSVEVMLSAAVRDAEPGGDESAAETGETATGRERGLERVAAVEAELEAEARSFGFGDEVSATVHGVGLERRERPADPADVLEPGAIVRVEGEIRSVEGIVRLADLLAIDPVPAEGADETSDEAGARWLSRPSHALDPAAVARSDTE